MEHSRVCLNDGSGSPPRLRLSHSLWGLSGLPMGGPEWSLEEKARLVKEAGFEAMECWLTPQNEAQVKEALDREGLRLALGHHPFSVEDTQRVLKQAERLGADYVFAQPGHAFMTEQEAAALVRDCVLAAEDAGITLFIETHRNTVTETLPQTLRLIEALPHIRLTADLSHYFVVSEFYGWESENLSERFAPILERTCGVHGRISNGEQIQVDVGDGTGDLAQAYVNLWTCALEAWLEGARPGDLFPFTPELGPPAYAIVHPDGSGEISDRWEQSLVMKQLGQEAWAKATRRTDVDPLHPSG